MIIVKLQGGLGNQMFQYAAARAVSNKQPVYADHSFFVKNNTSTANFTARLYELDVFKNIQIKKLNTTLAAVIGSNNKLCLLLKKIFFNGLRFIYDHQLEEYSAKNNHLYLDGYFQSEEYFNAVRPQLLHEFQFPPLPANAIAWQQKISIAVNAVSIHIRRGDYLKPHVSNYHGILPLTYYREAISLIDDKVESSEYFIFSDDPEWCKGAFKFLGKQAHIVSQIDNDWVDMALMSLCNHHIIANSSFSWWGAWLNNKKDKIVIAPKRWFNTENNTTHITPEKWLVI